MNHRNIKKVSAACIIASSTYIPFASAETFTEALTTGDTAAVFRLRHESVDQENAALDASALTLRSALQYTTKAFEGFSARVQLEDVRIVGGVDDYTVGPTGFNPGVYSVIADPESTEVNQGYLQYSAAGFTAKIGRQVLNYDNQRFIGAVGWRQDWQVYDAFSVTYTANEKLNFSYNYLDERERIFSEAADIDSKDHLFHASYDSPIGSLVGYGYLLELDNNTNNSLDTFGLRLTGSTTINDLNATYLAEFASQESEVGTATFDADYYVVEGGLTLSPVTVKLGYEVLGSDNGTYAFSTPLATGHAFNGWSDQFLGTPVQGLTDLYLNLSGKILGGTLTAIYHDFEADESTATIDDLGSEINIQFAKPFADHYTVGVKYADYSAGDAAAGKVDTQKLWVWLQASF